MLKEMLNEAKIEGGDMNVERRAVAEKIILYFENRLEYIANARNIERGYVRPFAVGSIICGNTDDTFYVGYIPNIGMNRLVFMNLTHSGHHSDIAFHRFLHSRTGMDFSVARLEGKWMNLDEASRNSKFDAVASILIANEMNRKKNIDMIVENKPLFGPNKYPVQPNFVFVLMPFRDDLTQIYNHVVKPAVEQKNLVVRRADEMHTNNAIMADVWKSICEARIIIADLTGQNPNVMYELGICHTIGKEVIMINQNNEQSKFPFDVSHIKIINYDNSAIGGMHLKQRLEETIEHVLSKIGGNLSS
ncbi:MAG: hypothetical protein NTW56_06020 [Alphaproteobacteria bacterium]|nr:hypothetical protein [Alphaproteobacteria bacterium]